VPFPEVDYLARPNSSTGIAIKHTYPLIGRLTTLDLGNRL
jgi:hypothetical protein